MILDAFHNLDGYFELFDPVFLSRFQNYFLQMPDANLNRLTNIYPKSFKYASNPKSDL